MGKLGEEVSQKIKSAIKAKLLELGINMENELPDYVMVLVANKKSQKQMEHDLQLFLGPSTTAFTSWLQCVLKKLEQVTVFTKGLKRLEKARRNSGETIEEEEGESAQKFISSQNNDKEEAKDLEETESPAPGNVPISKVAVKKECLSENEEETLENDCMDISGGLDTGEIPENETTPIERQPGMSILKATSHFERAGEKHEDSTGKRVLDNQPQSLEKNKELVNSCLQIQIQERERCDKSLKRSWKHLEAENLVKENKVKENKVQDAREIIIKKKIARNSDRHQTSKEFSDNERGKRRKQLSSVSKVIIREKEKPVDVSLPSLVKVTPRPKRTGIQPNCCLILKAVADAEKSVATAKTNKALRESREKNRFAPKDLRGYIPPAKIAITLPNDRVPSTKELEKINYAEDCFDEVTVETAPTASTVVEGVGELPDYSKRSAHEKNDLENRIDEEVPNFIVTLNKGITFSQDYYAWNNDEIELADPEEEIVLKESTIEETVQAPVVPKVPFNRSRLGPSPVVAVKPLQKVSVSQETLISKLEEPRKIIPSSVIKKCKFWPNCVASDSCPYHHPEAMCRLFPNCKYGDQCMFAHPPCKFGSKCQNSSCQYLHPWSSTSTSATAPPSAQNPQLCLFHPNCTNQFCRFQHPRKPCRFGVNCSNFNCPFDHNCRLPTIEQLKWKKLSG